MTQHTHPNRLLAQIALTILALAAALPAARAATFTWNGGATGNTTWGNGTNWVGGTAPATDGTATLSFGGNTTTSSNNTFTANTTFVGINFTNITGNATLGGGSFTLNGTAITLGGNITTTSVSGGAITDTINLNVVLNGSQTINTAQSGNATTSHNLTINGLISETGGSQGIIKAGGGTVLLGNASNSFSGPLTINAGTLQFNNIGALGSNNTINFGGGSLFYSGNTPLTLNQTLNIVSTSGGFQNGGGANAVTLNGTITGLNSGTTFTVNGGGANGIIASNITNNGTFALNGSGAWNVQGVISGNGSVQSQSTGVLTLSNSGNTFTGQITAFSNSTLTVTSAGALGSGSSVIQLGTGAGEGVLNYNSSTDGTTNRNLKLGNVAAALGNSRVNITGTGNLTFTNASFVGLQTTWTTNHTLTLGGNGSGVGIVQGAIINNGNATNTSITSVIKTESSKWVFSGNNTYTGTTAVNGGTLQLNASSGSALGQTSGISVSSGGTLLLSQSNQINNSANMTLAGGTIKFGSAVSEGGNSTVGLGALTLTADSTLDFNSLAGTITFATGFTPGTFKLNVTNWTLNSSHLYFNQDESSFLSSFTVNGLAAQQFSLGNGFYEITAVPEPGTIAAGLAVLGLIAWRERKRLALIVRRSTKSAVIS